MRIEISQTSKKLGKNFRARLKFSISFQIVESFVFLSNFDFLIESGNRGGLGREVRGERVVGAAARRAVGDVDKSHSGASHRGDYGGHLAGAGAVRDSREVVLVTGFLGGGGGALHPRREVAVEGGRGALENDDRSRNSQISLIGLGARVQDGVGVS